MEFTKLFCKTPQNTPVCLFKKKLVSVTKKGKLMKIDISKSGNKWQVLPHCNVPGNTDNIQAYKNNKGRTRFLLTTRYTQIFYSRSAYVLAANEAFRVSDSTRVWLVKPMDDQMFFSIDENSTLRVHRTKEYASNNKITDILDRRLFHTSGVLNAFYAPFYNYIIAVQDNFITAYWVETFEPVSSLYYYSLYDPIGAMLSPFTLIIISGGPCFISAIHIDPAEMKTVSSHQTNSRHPSQIECLQDEKHFVTGRHEEDKSFRVWSFDDEITLIRVITSYDFPSDRVDLVPASSISNIIALKNDAGDINILRFDNMDFPVFFHWFTDYRAICFYSSGRKRMLSGTSPDIDQLWKYMLTRYPEAKEADMAVRRDTKRPIDKRASDKKEILLNSNLDEFQICLFARKKQFGRQYLPREVTEMIVRFTKLT